MIKKDYTAKLLNLEDVIITKVEVFIHTSKKRGSGAASNDFEKSF